MFVQAFHEATTTYAAAGGDIFDFGTSMSSKTQRMVITFAGVVAVVLVLIKAWQSKGALPAIISAFVVGVLVIFAVKNVGNAGVQDKISNTFDSGMQAPPPISQTWDGPSGPSS